MPIGSPMLLPNGLEGGAQIPRAGSKLGGTESPELTISAGLVSSGDSGEPVSDLADLRRAKAALSQLS